MEPFISTTPGFSFAPPIVHDLKCFSEAALAVSGEMQTATNGKHSKVKDTALQMLFHNLFHFEIPEDHAQQIAAVIHGWIKEPVPEGKIERFGERAIKKVRQLQAEFSPSHAKESTLPQA